MSCTVRPPHLLRFLVFLVLGPNAFPQGPPGYNLSHMTDGPDPAEQVGVRFQSYDQTLLTFTSKPTYVLVPVVVTNKEGRAVSGLKKEDFQVQENGKDQKVA